MLQNPPEKLNSTRRHSGLRNERHLIILFDPDCFKMHLEALKMYLGGKTQLRWQKWEQRSLVGMEESSWDVRNVPHPDLDTSSVCQNPKKPGHLTFPHLLYECHMFLNFFYWGKNTHINWRRKPIYKSLIENNWPNQENDFSRQEFQMNFYYGHNYWPHGTFITLRRLKTPLIWFPPFFCAYQRFVSESLT